MRCLFPRIFLLGGVLLAAAACATEEEWAEWKAHPAHFASADHFAFSLRNRHEPPLVVEPRDVALASAEKWWGGPFEEPPFANVAGRWTGTWSGHGLGGWPFSSSAEARFTQQGRYGEGRLVLADTLTMDVPQVVTDDGLQGVPVVLEVTGSKLVVRHWADRRWLVAEFTVAGDRMTGRFKNSSATLVLARQP